MAKEMTSELRHKDGTPMRKYNSPKLQAIEMEISDEEIEKEARKLANIEHNRPLDSEERYYKDYQKYDGIVIGMKWYREQLKKK